MDTQTGTSPAPSDSDMDAWHQAMLQYSQDTMQAVQMSAAHSQILRDETLVLIALCVVMFFVFATLLARRSG